MRYVLFDIDGTLTVGGSGGGAGARALNIAFEAMFGIQNAFDNISKAGKTDPIILADGFAANGVEKTADNTEEFMNRYLENLEELLKVEELRSKVLPGAREILEDLTSEEDVHIGILTGNWSAGARLKLASVGLDGYINGLGAFGEDAPTRPGLVPVAWKRFEEKKQMPVSPEETLIIGDTPRDIQAAHENGIRALAVTTGPFSEEELTEADADLILPGLEDADAVKRFIRGS